MGVLLAKRWYIHSREHSSAVVTEMERRPAATEVRSGGWAAAACLRPTEVPGPIPLPRLWAPAVSQDLVLMLCLGADPELGSASGRAWGWHPSPFADVPPPPQGELE